MYSFEYNGTVSKGINFLRGLPIVSASANNTNAPAAAHGDELGYMFDCNDIYGNPLPETRLTSADDLRVRNNMIDMIVRFASAAGQNEATGSSFTDSIFKSVTGKGIPFLKVDTNLQTSNDFRFCELSVLGANLSPLTSISCEGLGNIFSSLTDTLGNLGKNLGGPDFGNTNFGGILNTGSNTANKFGGFFNRPLTVDRDNTGVGLLG